ncbi:MAG: HK97-gp10 family putative phage morphogenesis protein [Phycisphaerales bacterium]
MPAVKPGVIGLKETADALKAIGIVVTASADRKALYAGAVVVRDVARKNAPKRTGALKKAISARTKRISNGAGGTSTVGQVFIAPLKFKPTTTKTGKASLKRFTHKKGSGVRGYIYPRNYAHFPEFGTSRMAAKPYLRPAEISSRNQVVAAYRAVILREIEKKARQLAEKNPVKGKS